jgi:hypothetical protein
MQRPRQASLVAIVCSNYSNSSGDKISLYVATLVVIYCNHTMLAFETGFVNQRNS